MTTKKYVIISKRNRNDEIEHSYKLGRYRPQFEPDDGIIRYLTRHHEALFAYADIKKIETEVKIRRGK